MFIGIDDLLPEDQFGFRKVAVGTRDDFNIKVIEEQLRKSKMTFISFVDLEKAFDNVNWNALFYIGYYVKVVLAIENGSNREVEAS